MSLSHVQQLLALVPPIRQADEIARDEIHRLAQGLGLTLPPTYLELVRYYGVDGYWQQFWYLLDPRGDGAWSSGADDLSGRNFLSAERVIRKDWPDEVPYPIFPEPGGILPWAATDNGGRFFWVTEGDPEKWSTIYSPDRSGPFQEIRMDVAEIILGLVSGRSRLFEEEFGEDYEYQDILTYEWPGA